MSEPTTRHWKRGSVASPAFLRAVNEQSYDSIIVVDPAGRIRYQSPSTRYLLGYRDGEVLGRQVLEFPHPQDRSRVRRAFAAVGRAAGGTCTIEVRLRHSDGQWLWAQARLTNRLNDPSVRGIVINTVLIEDRKALELQHAAAKLDPHFLFNVLHSIAALVREGKGPEAVEALARIRALTEGTLASAEGHAVALREEWDWTRDYLALEQLRFGPELQLDIRELTPEIAEIAVPCRLVQPLVENAIKHGLRARPGGGVFRLRAERRGREVRIHVEEEGAPIPAAQGESRGAEPGGIHGFRLGLRTLRERLALYYGDAAALALHVEPTGSAAVLRFPFETHHAPLAREA